MPAATADRKTDAALIVAGLAAAVLSFHAWGPVAAVAAALLAGLTGMRARLPVALVLAVSAAAGSAVIHFAVAPEHFGEWWGFGLFFVICAEVQLGWAFFLGRRRTTPMLAIGIAGSLLLVGVWALSRTTGLPFGPEPGVAEEIGIPDLVSVALELVTVAACTWALLVPRARLTSARMPVRALALVGSVAVTTWALTAIAAG